ncbi:hypothetical protein MBLNU457_3165t1 [Dothideomycetes sp. NU457]
MISILLTLPFALLPALVSADCSIFKPDMNYTTVSKDAIPLSAGQTCNGPKDCWYHNLDAFGVNMTKYNLYPIQIGGIITANSTIDYNTTVADKTSLLNLIAANTEFKPQTITTNLTTGVGYGRNAGTSGYMGYKPYLTCYNGTVSGCSGDGFPMNGTVIAGCMPQGQNGPQCSTTGQLSNGDPCLYGVITWVNTTEAVANRTHAPSESGSAATVRRADAALIAALVGVVIAFIA